MTRFFFINLGITCLSTVILYLYFRNKIGKMEQKVDLMFQLIQEYNQQQQVNNNNNHPQQMSNNTEWANKQDDLISVSDDDSDSDSDSDSEEISDTESIPLNISEETVNNNIKTINLAGAEIDLVEADASDNLDDISDIDDSENNIITLDENHDNQSENNDNQLENNDNTITNTDIKEINVKEDKPLKDYTVKELKSECEKRGFINYKALRKPKLIDLLQKHTMAENNI